MGKSAQPAAQVKLTDRPKGVLSSQKLLWLRQLHRDTTGAATLETIALAAIVAIFFIALLTVMQNRGHDVIAGRMNTNIDCQISLWRSGSNGNCGPGGLNPGEGNNGNVSNPTPTPPPPADGASPSSDLQKIADCMAEFGLAFVGEDGFWGDVTGIWELLNDINSFKQQLPPDQQMALTLIPGALEAAYVKDKIEKLVNKIADHPELVEEVRKAIAADPSIILKVLFPNSTDAIGHDQYCRLGGMWTYSLVPLKWLKALATLDKMTPNELTDVAKVIRNIHCINSFSAGTLVMTNNGPTPIAEIAVGDLVLAYHEETGKVDFYPVIDTISHVDSQYIALTIDGEYLETTAAHPFYEVEIVPWPAQDKYIRKWTIVSELQPGDLIQRADGSFGTVSSIKIVNQPKPMYNLTVAEAHTFFVGNGQWLVHNTGPCGPKGLIGTDFEKWLSKTFGGQGSFKVAGREFDGAIGTRWLEAKSGRYWERLQLGGKEFDKFKSDMGDRLKIAKDNGATYELHSNTPIPQHVKDWLTSKNIPYFEHLE